MTVDRTVTFSSVGGLFNQVRSLREMVVLPLLYPEVFAKFSVTPPRGVLFYGPPGNVYKMHFFAIAKQHWLINCEIACHCLGSLWLLNLFISYPINSLLPSAGTGKTLVARALANECSKGDKRVAFFMRKGADCLSKWVGESERQLRLLFDQVCTDWFLQEQI